MQDFIILDQEKHSGFRKATKLKKDMELTAFDKLTPSAKTLMFYAVFFHQHYKMPFPSGRKFRKVLGWSDATFYRAIDSLLRANALKAVGEGPTRKVFINPRLLSDETEDDQFKFFRVLMKWQELGTTDVPLETDFFASNPPKPSGSSSIKKTRRPNIVSLMKKKMAKGQPPKLPALPEEPDWLTEAPFDNYPEDAE